jgi:hypothetical protein
MAPILKLKCLGDEAVNRVKNILNESGLRVLISFDSHQARGTVIPAACPHHGASNCDCQIVILLVYDEEREPATLLLHGQDGETWISLAAAPGYRQPALLRKKIATALHLLAQ